MKRKRESVEIETTARTKPSKHSDENAEDTTTQTRDTDSNINTAIGKMDNRLLADYVAQRTKRFGEDLSLVELEDMHVPESAIVDTSAWDQDRLAANLPDFLIQIAQQHGASTDLSQAPVKPGSPHTLVLTGAALRAAELSRVLRKFQGKEATVAKLFAKHIKLKDATVFVKKTRINIGVGTPTRIIDLLAERALRLEKLERVIIDTSFLDCKKRSIFDMKETQQPLMRLLNMDELKSRYTTTGSAVKLIFY
ncbi:MAG: hypothetical protein L6R38_001632 [Xanthoria sp. 2 TBL-2021]|nr:MAG: hypothetical protein L6R38_001632 [Xanthoria sp. 2 TBL-2021]